MPTTPHDDDESKLKVEGGPITIGSYGGYSYLKDGQESDRHCVSIPCFTSRNSITTFC